MPRPPRCRRIWGVPQVDTFCPNGCENTEPILLTPDEYEVIRLVDLEQQTHEQCAAQMDISCSTVQEIYESARSKIAAYLVHGKPLHITGGNYRICGGQEAVARMLKSFSEDGLVELKRGAITLRDKNRLNRLK